MLVEQAHVRLGRGQRAFRREDQGAGHGEEPIAVVHLDRAIFITRLAARPRLRGADEDLHAGAGRADLAVAVELIQDRRCPRLGLAGCRVDAAVQIDPGEGIVRTEHEADALQASSLACSDGLLERTPGRRVGGRSVAALGRTDRALGGFAVALDVGPTHPLGALA